MSRETSDKDEELSTTACAKSRAVPPVPVTAAVSSARAIPTTLDPSDPPPAGPLPSPAVIAEAAEVDAVLDAWARGPETPPAAQELRRTIKRARSTSGSKDSPTP
jgi:hypothetical protein